MKDDLSNNEKLSYWDEHRFLLLIAISVTIAIILTVVSMTLYSSSGAMQLDLSRPNLKTVTSQAATNDSGYQSYSSIGPIDAKSTAEFKALYDAQAAKAKAVDAFSGDPLNPDSLEISEATGQ
jgi:hypothetical protein